MSKSEEKRPDVVWQVTGDGMEPKVAPWGFIGRNPVLQVVMPERELTISLRVAANVPLLAFPLRKHVGVVTIGGRGDGSVIPAGTDIVVTVKNDSAHSPLTIDSAEGLVALHPLLFSGTGGVG